jgi:hypothetical protein
MMIYPEGLHPGPVKQRKRGKLGGGPPVSESRKKPGRSKPIDDGLTAAFSWFSENGRSVVDMPLALRTRARTHVDARIEFLTALASTSSRDGKRTERIRVQLRWLCRWSSILTHGSNA